MFNLTTGPRRPELPAAEAERLRARGVLVADPRRSRPRWFDGRFLAARDLSREQDYVLTRQADLAEAAGTGIAVGLAVREGSSATEIRIEPGYGVAAGGARVALMPEDSAAGSATDVIVDLADLPYAGALNADLGLASVPATPDRVRSGVFILALRPVEYTGSPIGRYPTTPGDVRGVQDGETIEAALITLIPFAEDGAYEDEDQRRSAAARQAIAPGWRPPAGSLPLALLRLERNQLRWLDVHAVRRSLGDARADPLGLGLAPRPQRLALLRQYQDQLGDVLAERARNGRSLRFAASEHFAQLPPGGPLPVACIDPDTLVQHYFPAAMDVDLAVIPQDELAVVLEESFLLPPVPLSGDAVELAGTSILVLIPIPRRDLASFARKPVATRRPLADPLLAGKPDAKSWSALYDLRSRLGTAPLSRSAWLAAGRGFAVPGGARTDVSLDQGGADPATSDAELRLDAARWRSLLAAAGSPDGTGLWYVRRRNLAFQDSLAGVGRAIATDQFTAEETAIAFTKASSIAAEYTKTQSGMSSAARGYLAAYIQGKSRTRDDFAVRAVFKAVAAQTDPKIDEGLLRELTSVSDKHLDAGSAVVHTLIEPELKPDGAVNAAAVKRNAPLKDRLSTPDALQTIAKYAPELDPAKLTANAPALREAIIKATSQKDAQERLVEGLEKMLP